MKKEDLHEWLLTLVRKVAPARTVHVALTGPQLSKIFEQTTNRMRMLLRALAKEGILREVRRGIGKTYLLVETELFATRPFIISYGTVNPRTRAAVLAQEDTLRTKGVQFLRMLNQCTSSSFSEDRRAFRQCAVAACGELELLGVSLETFFDYVCMRSFSPISLGLICSKTFIHQDFGVYLSLLKEEGEFLEEINRTSASHVPPSDKSLGKVRNVRRLLGKYERTEAQYLAYVEKRGLNFNISVSETFLCSDFLRDVDLEKSDVRKQETFVETFLQKAKFCLVSPNGRKRELLCLTSPVHACLEQTGDVPECLLPLVELSDVPSSWLVVERDDWKLTQEVASWLYLLAIHFAVLRLDFSPIGYDWKKDLLPLFMEGVSFR